MCSIYNYIHLHIHKCIHIELPCLFVVVFAQQNKLSKNCRKGSYSNFLNRSLSLLERTPSSASQIGQCLWIGFLPLDVIRIFVLKKKKAQKKDSVFFFAGGKRKKRARRRERILEVQVSEVETCCVQVESRKEMTLTFLQKKKAFKIRTVCESVVPFDPPAPTPFVWRENGPSGSRLGYWQLSRTSVKSKIMLEAFSAPMVFGKFQFLGANFQQTNKKCKTHNKPQKKRQAIHLFGDSTEKIAPISSLPQTKPSHAGNPFVMLALTRAKIPRSSVFHLWPLDDSEVQSLWLCRRLVGWSSNYTSVAKLTWFFGPKIYRLKQTPVLFEKNR